MTKSTKKAAAAVQHASIVELSKAHKALIAKGEQICTEAKGKGKVAETFACEVFEFLRGVASVFEDALRGSRPCSLEELRLLLEYGALDLAESGRRGDGERYSDDHLKSTIFSTIAELIEAGQVALPETAGDNRAARLPWWHNTSLDPQGAHFDVGTYFDVLVYCGAEPRVVMRLDGSWALPSVSGEVAPGVPLPPLPKDPNRRNLIAAFLVSEGHADFAPDDLDSLGDLPDGTPALLKAHIVHSQPANAGVAVAAE